MTTYLQPSFDLLALCRLEIATLDDKSECTGTLTFRHMNCFKRAGSGILDKKISTGSKPTHQPVVRGNNRLVRTIHQFFLEMSRPQKQAVFACIDGVGIIACLLIAMSFRYGQVDFPDRNNLTWLLIALPVVGIATYWILGLYNVLIRAMESRTIGIISGGAVMLMLFVAAASYMDNGFHIPRSVPPIFGILVFMSIGLSRVLARAYYHYVTADLAIRENILIYGAGSAGTQLAAAIQSGNHYRIVGFIDDDPRLKGGMIRGCRVYNSESVEKLKQRHNVRRVLIALANATPAQRRAVVARLAPLKLELQTIPPLVELMRGRADVQQLKDIRLEDLLGRTTVHPMTQLFDDAIRGKSILVTGAGGSIGSELCRQILKAQPRRLVLLESSELALYNIETRLRKKMPIGGPVEIVCALGDVRDPRRVRTLLTRHHIDIVYHAAAYKHVPIVEANPSQGVRNNIFGTLAVAQEAAAYGVERFILISTDKAVRPSNVMGASKRLAEQVIQDIQKRADRTIFTIVRFGNVLGSSGSVIHLFKDQIAHGGPVTVTREDVTRYFMTIQEAAQLVVQAGSMAEGGEVFVLDMGEPVKIMDLAELMIQLSGKTVRDAINPEGDIAIDIVGLRAGEKLYEELLINDTVIGTLHPKIMRAEEKTSPDAPVLAEVLRRLERDLDNDDPFNLKLTLQSAVEGYIPDNFGDPLTAQKTGQVLSLEEIRSLRQKGR